MNHAAVNFEIGYMKRPSFNELEHAIIRVTALILLTIAAGKLVLTELAHFFR